jgi:uncharacterized protein (TIGR02231 family)
MFKKILLNISLLVVANGFLYAQPEKKVKIEIKSVVLSLQQAQVTTEAFTEIEHGFHKIVLHPIPSNLTAEDLHLSGNGKFTILGINYRLSDTRLSPKSRELLYFEDSLENISELIDSIEYCISALNEEKALITLEKNKAIGGSNIGVKATEMEDLADLFRERLPKIQLAIQKSKKKQLLLQDKYTYLKNKLDELPLQKDKSNGELVVSIQTSVKSNIYFKLDYPVFEAGWKPIYDFNFNKNFSENYITKKAIVYQNSGILWKDVALTLTTLKDIGTLFIPNFNKSEIDFYEPIVYRTRRLEKAAAPMLMESNKAVEDSKQMNTISNESAVFAVAETNAAPIGNVTYKLPLNYSIPSNNQPQIFNINSEPLKPTFKYLVHVRQDVEPLFIAQITDWENLNLLDGKASVLVDGNHTSSTNIITQNTSDTLNFPLIKEHKIIIKREKIKEFSSKKLIGLQKRDENAFEITVRNTKSIPVSIEVIDQISVSKNSQIEVEFNNESGALYEPETGKLTWELQLSPQETKKISFKFAIKYPKDKNITFW